MVMFWIIENPIHYHVGIANLLKLLYCATLYNMIVGSSIKRRTVMSLDTQ